MRMRLAFAIALVVAGLGASSGAWAQPAAPAPPNFGDLADQPGTHTGVVFDRNMMQLAQGVLESGGLNQDRAAAALRSISFDTYRYPRPAFYTPEAMAALMASYRAGGWKHLVNGNPSPANSAQPKATLTDLWLHFSGGDIDNLVVLIRQPRTMNVIQVAGDLRPLDLIHLSGHFGIPRVDPSAVMVPAPDGK
jgi:hypothetical protein